MLYKREAGANEYSSPRLHEIDCEGLVDFSGASPQIIFGRRWERACLAVGIEATVVFDDFQIASHALMLSWESIQLNQVQPYFLNRRPKIAGTNAAFISLNRS